MYVLFKYIRKWSNRELSEVWSKLRMRTLDVTELEFGSQVSEGDLIIYPSNGNTFESEKGH